MSISLLLVLLLAGFGLLILLANLLSIRLRSKLILILLLLLLSRLPVLLADLLGIGLGRSFGLESHSLSPPVCIVPRKI